MKIPKGKNIKQIPFNHSSCIDCKTVMNLYKKCSAKPYSFLVNDTLLPKDNVLRFRSNILEKLK